MKKKVSKLRLSRETMVRLDAIQAGIVSGNTCDPCGGGTDAGAICSQTCPYSCGTVCTFGC